MLPAPRSPTLVPGDWAIALSRGRSEQGGRCDAARTPRLHPHPKAHRIVTLVASDPQSASREAFGLRPVTHNPVARESRQKPPGLPPRASGSVRRGLGPGTRSFRLAVPRPVFHLAVPGCLFRRAEAPLSIHLSDCFRPVHWPRATRCICGSPSLFRGTREACFPTLLRASLPDRSVMFSPLLPAVSCRNLRSGFTVSTRQSCASQASRASTNLRTYPQMR